MLNSSRWAAAALLICSCAPSFAATQYFINDQAGWLAATTLTSTITFDSAIPGYTPPAAGSYVSLPLTGLIVDGFTIQNQIDGVNRTMQAVSDTFASPYYQWNSGVIIRGDDHTTSQESKFLINLPVGITSFGIDLMLGFNVPSSYQVKVNGALIGTVPTTLRPDRNFFGITSGTDISTLEFINPTGSYPILDNLSYGVIKANEPLPPPPSETPELSTLLLSGSALFCFSRMRRGQSLTA